MKKEGIKLQAAAEEEEEMKEAMRRSLVAPPQPNIFQMDPQPNIYRDSSDDDF